MSVPASIKDAMLEDAAEQRQELVSVLEKIGYYKNWGPLWRLATITNISGTLTLQRLDTP